MAISYKTIQYILPLQMASLYNIAQWESKYLTKNNFFKKVLNYISNSMER